MQPKGLPIFRKLSNFLKASIFIARMRKPVIPKLIFLKKATRLQKFELLTHYNNGFVQEYQFSPPTTPLFHRYRQHFNTRARRRHIYSVLFPCTCLGSFVVEEGAGDYRVEETLPAIEGPFSEALDWSDEEDSIDQRAEMFIEKFYAEMKMERLASI